MARHRSAVLSPESMAGRFADVAWRHVRRVFGGPLIPYGVKGFEPATGASADTVVSAAMGPYARGLVRRALQLLRPHQWIKNLFVAAPLFFTPEAVSLEAITLVAIGFLSFSAVSSAVYILNDYIDRAADRQHPTKKSRPLAAGTVPIPVAFGLMFVLAAGGLASGFWLASNFGWVLVIYLLINAAYSLGLKNLAIIDVMSIALGFVLRVYAGGVLIGIEPTVWMIACTMLLALFIALAKRRDDVVKGVDISHRQSLNGYTKRFLDIALAITLSTVLISYLLYTVQPENMERLGTDRLYLTTPWVIAGLLRYLQVTLVEEQSGSPTRVVLTDRFLFVVSLGWLATFGSLIYG